MLEFASLVILTAVLVSLIVFALRGRKGARPANPELGTLFVTGVSPRPDAPGEQYVTITGELTGPSVPGTVVYGRFTWDTSSRWPEVGDLLTVVYPAGKPERWQISQPG
ncbi:hypothetical protein OHA40_24550 [Nocardia sp. NBC_00508]|uniref:hypothetical protein n=1 Tax=Nocardia sp. NBC_00508 TaxID=2975992 RepID=UPI002E81828B|nr:hypothetical protein [Nocardia sp. NBC_00508]WUD64828.1 hypothetical protein OHA40_24550 [Nocardia sp. NBC_00508]